MAMRQHHGLDCREIHAKPRAIALHCVIHRAAIKQHRAGPARDISAHHERKPVIGAAERTTHGALHALALQPHPFARHKTWRGGKTIRDIIHQHCDFDAIHRDGFGHGLLPSALLARLGDGDDKRAGQDDATAQPGPGIGHFTEENPAKAHHGQKAQILERRDGGCLPRTIG